MKIFFHHICGQMSDKTIIYCSALANFKNDEEDYALDNGWAIDEWMDEEPRVWFQARQTRLRVSDLKYNKKTRKMIRPCSGIKSEFKPLEQSNLHELEKIYEKYTKYRNFSQDMKISSLYLDLASKWIIEYREEETLHAFTIFRIYEEAKAMASIQFCWDYHKPKIFLGKYSTIKELEFAKEKGLEYVYMMPGYENICSYKSCFQGFEFWNGKQWLDDKNVYKSMCERDSEMKTLSDLNSLTIEYEKKYFYCDK